MTAESTVTSSSAPEDALELADIQAEALIPRPTPYAGSYQIVRIDDPHAGRELLRRLMPYVDSAASFDPQKPVALGVALSFHGLKALGVPEESLTSFPPEFQQGMAARAAHLGDVGADPKRNNAFMYGDDPKGLKCPVGSHVRRMNPRDGIVIGTPRIHRMIRRGTTYGPPLPGGVLEDDGADRGLMFAFIGAHLDRQFEFIQSEWVNDGKFNGSPAEKDPLVGANDGGQFTIPKQPIRRRIQGLPAFVVNRGGEYCFMPSLRALRWLAEMDT